MAGKSLNDRELMTLLEGVSRSFVLTIRALPRELRRPIGTAYLLARASDTIADTATTPAAVRAELLRGFGEMVGGARRPMVAERLVRELGPESEAERFLLRNVERILAVLETLPGKDRLETVTLLEKITHGQTLDLMRFPELGTIHALGDAAELDEYTYLVAGCVGEFWTRVCTGHLPRYSRLNGDDLCRLGRAFGQGLQLVNILRDLPEDLRNGRCYLPLEELRAHGLENMRALQENPAAVAPVLEAWRQKALACHRDAQAYIEAIRPWRIRLACLLPWALGVRTLQLLGEKSPLQQGQRVKVARPEVRRMMRRALWAAFSNAAVRKWARDLACIDS